MPPASPSRRQASTQAGSNSRPFLSSRYCRAAYSGRFVVKASNTPATAKNAGSDRNGVRLETPWIAGAIPALVVRSGNSSRRSGSARTRCRPACVRRSSHACVSQPRYTERGHLTSRDYPPPQTVSPTGRLHHRLILRRSNISPQRRMVTTR